MFPPETEQELTERMGQAWKEHPPHGPYGAAYRTLPYVGMSPTSRETQRLVLDALQQRLESCRASVIESLLPGMPPVESYEFSIAGKRADKRLWCLHSKPLDRRRQPDKWGSPDQLWYWWPPELPGTTWHAQQVGR